MIASWEWILLLVLLIMSGLFSGSETALISLNRLKIHHLVKNGVPNAALVEKLISDPNKLLSTILVGNNIVNISASALVTSIALRLFGQAGVGIAVAILTILILIFGEITPKAYAASNNERVALRIARLIKWAEILFSPVVKVLGLITAKLLNFLGDKSSNGKVTITEEEIITLLGLGKTQGSIEPSEEEMIASVFDLNDTLVREVMIPRVDIVGVPAEDSLRKAWNIIVDTNHSRIPVFSNGVDNIIGILYTKDLIKYVDFLEEKTVRDIMREPYFVPETKNVSELLKDLKRERVHISVVLDEYGGTAGLVFLEDLIETITGPMGDEYDDLHPLIEEVCEGELLVSSRVTLDDINDLLNIDLPQEEHETIGGLVFHLFGYVPAKDETIKLTDVTFTVKDVEKNIIKRIQIKTNK